MAFTAVVAVSFFVRRECPSLDTRLFCLVKEDDEEETVEFFFLAAGGAATIIVVFFFRRLVSLAVRMFVGVCFLFVEAIEEEGSNEAGVAPGEVEGAAEAVDKEDEEAVQPKEADDGSFNGTSAVFQTLV